MNKLFFGLILLVFLVSACSNEIATRTKGSLLVNDYAENFSIHRISNGYILKVIDNNGNSFEYLLSSDNEKKSNGYNIINIPVQSVVCLSSSHVAFINLLNKSNSIKAVSGVNYLFDPKIRNEVRNNNIIEAGYENKIDYEKILSLNPDVIFAYSLDNNSFASLQKFNELNIPVVFINEFIEPTYTGRTEWLKFFACFYDELDFAIQYCDSVFQNYEQLKELASNTVENPRVISSMPWKGVWWSPGGNSYFSRLISDAGGDYIFKDNQKSESIPFSLEEVFSSANDIDFWLNPNNYRSKQEMLQAEDRIRLFEPFQNAKIYNNNRRINQNGGNDFWESGLIHPDIVLKDLIYIFHPDLIENHNLFYYREIR